MNNLLDEPVQGKMILHVIYVCYFTAEEVLFYENYDLENLVTPVKAERLEFLLRQAGYDSEKSEFLVQGFKNGFSLEYEGDRTETTTAPNLRFLFGNKLGSLEQSDGRSQKGEVCGSIYKTSV